MTINSFKYHQQTFMELKIVVLINGWSGKIISGGDYHILRVIKNWTESHEISIIMPKFAYDFTKNKLTERYSIHFSSEEKDEQLRSTIGLLRAYFVRILKSLSIRSLLQKPDIIIASSHFLYDVLPATVLCRRFNSKLVVYVHMILRSTRTYREGTTSNLSLLNEKLGLFLSKKFADLIFAINSDIKDVLVSRGFDAMKVLVIGNGVEREFIDSVKAGMVNFDGCFCARLVQRKGVYDLIELWKIVLKHRPHSKLVIIGIGSEYVALEELISKQGLGKSVILTGFLPEKEKISTMKSSKIFIFPSYEESWAIAVGEALSCGLPVVCYDLSAYEIYGDATIKIEVGNKEAMARTVIDLLEHEDKQAALALNAKKKAEGLLNWNDIATEELKEINRINEIKLHHE